MKPLTRGQRVAHYVSPVLRSMLRSPVRVFDVPAICGRRDWLVVEGDKAKVTCVCCKAKMKRRG